MNDSQFKILLVGGGTGGHFYPLIAIAEILRTHETQPKLYYAGPDTYDTEALVTADISFVRIIAGKRRRYFSFLNFLDIFKIFFGILQAVVKLFVIYPDVVMSKGGYTSVPVILAAKFLRIPIVVHESDAVMGAANTLGAKFARYIITAYENVLIAENPKLVQQLGIPVRKALLQKPDAGGADRLHVDPRIPLILVLGGSQGAERVNDLILQSLDELLPDFFIIHQTGVQNFELCKKSADTLIPDQGMRSRYHPVPFLDSAELNDAYNTAGLVISRAGSTSIYEIALHGKPSILIPIPEEISHDQRTNAYAYARLGGAVVVEEKNLKDGLLRSEIDRIMQDTAVYTAMSTAAATFARRDTATEVSRLLMQIAQEHVK